MAATTNVHGFNIGGNNNSFDQRGHFYRGVFSGNVTGMLVKQNSTPNMTVLVEHGSALLNKNTTSASIAEIKSDTSVTIDTANTSNPRIDTVVIYEDTSVAIPTVEANYWQDGAGGRFKIVSLPGTAAASPVALSDANIQTAIGAGKPWTRLADITVPTNSTTILNSNIADKRKIVSPNISNYGTAGVLTTDASGNVTVDGIWTAWTPTTTNFDITKATLNFAKYAKIGKTVNFKIQYTLTSNAVGIEPTFSLPVAAAGGSVAYVSVGSAVLNDVGTQTTYGPVLLKNTTSICAYAYNAGSTYLQYSTVSATVPHTWANTDTIYMQGTYEAA